MTDNSVHPKDAEGEGGDVPISGLDDVTAGAFGALLRVGSPQPEIFSLRSRMDMERFAQQQLATAGQLQALAAIRQSGGASADDLLPEDVALPAVLLLLHDGQVYDALVTRFIDQFEYVALQHNQFLLFEDGERTELRSLYEEFLDELELGLSVDPFDPSLDPDFTSDRAADPAAEAANDEAPGAHDIYPSDDLTMVREIIAGHHGRLWQYGRDLLEQQMGAGESERQTATDARTAAGQAVPIAGQPSAATVQPPEAQPDLALAAMPPCHEYDPAFQLALWGVRPSDLEGPVLDLGCGEHALLVNYLREAGVEAWGLERFGSASEYVWTGDWLDSPLDGGRWGTIISHMGFSNHFFHHHLRQDGHPERYARRFMEILDALKPGGRFLYAPGLPFIEPLLPEDRFHVSTHPIEVDAERLADLLGESLNPGEDPRQPALYATEIRRI